MSTKTPKTSREGKRLIELMKRNEKLFADLYKKYSLIFENREFWLQLAKEEIRHAEWLDALLNSRDVFSLRLDLLPLDSVQMIGDDILEEIKRKDFPSLSGALNQSIRFEKSFLERNYFDFITVENASVKRVIEDLKRETAEHIKSVERELADVL